MIFQPFSFIGGYKEPISVTNDGQNATSGTNTEYNYNGIGIEPGLIVVVINSEASNTAGTVSGVTLNGVSMTQAVQNSRTSGTTVSTAIHYLRNVSSYSGNFSIGFTNAAFGCGMGIFIIKNNISDTPTQIVSTGSTTPNTSLSVTFNNLASDTVGILGDVNATATGESWTNATSAYGATITAFRSSGAYFITTTEGNRTITSTNASSNPMVLTGVVWR